MYLNLVGEEIGVEPVSVTTLQETNCAYQLQRLTCFVRNNSGDRIYTASLFNNR
jgi:hypothetical protein